MEKEVKIKLNNPLNLFKFVPEIGLRSNIVKRTVTGLSLLAGFFIVIYIGLPLILISGLVIQLKCFSEIINIAYTIKNIPPDIPYFRTSNWYFVVVANYYFIGETFAQYLAVIIKKYYIVRMLFAYHRFLSFCWYFAGILWFITLTRKKLIRQQFSLLAWTHFLLIIIILQTYMIIENVFEGLIWLIVPLWLIILNDVFAYVFGSILGKTPLISLSPKKTMEGFVFGGLCTFVFGALISFIFCHVAYLTCPIKIIEEGDVIRTSTNCTPSYLFTPAPYQIGSFSLSIYPFIFHSLAMSAFATFVAPFGGFCASGFKRAFKIKDFSDLIPGHGGLMDRFDCQFLMATFVNVYIHTFVRTPTVEKVFKNVLNMSTDKQLKFFSLLQKSLSDSGIIGERNT